jgi:dipeptidyl aminopeptidase/acylaminoacyl peptidase
MKRITISLITLVWLIELPLSNVAIRTQTLEKGVLSPLPLEEALARRSFIPQMPISLSPDGQWVAYTLQDARRKQSPSATRSSIYSPTGVLLGLLGCDVWVSSLDTGEAHNLTNGRGTSWGPSWSPDGERLAFYSDRTGASALWVWERRTDRLRQLGDVSVRASPIDLISWTPDGTQVAVRTLSPGFSPEQALEAMNAPPEDSNTQPSGRSPGTTVKVYRAGAAMTGDKSGQSKAQLQAYTRRSLADLALVDVRNGSVKRLALNQHPGLCAISPDGQKLAYTEYKGLESDQETQPLYDLVVLPIASPDQSPRTVATNIRQEAGRSVSWSPDGQMLAYTTSGPLARGDVFLVPAAGGEPRNLTGGPHPNFGEPFGAPLWDRRGSTIYLPVRASSPGSDMLWRVTLAEGKAAPFARIPDRTIINIVARAGGRSFWSPDGGQTIAVQTRNPLTKDEGLYKVDAKTGAATKLFEEALTFGVEPRFKVDVSVDGRRIIYSSQSAGQSEDLWAIDPLDNKGRVRITHANPNLDKYLMGKSRLVEWRSADGAALQGALLLPAGYQQGMRYPLIVSQYPGGLRSNLTNFYGLTNTGSGTDDMQVLATRGYAILLPDVPAGVRGQIMLETAKAVLPGINKVVEMGIADPGRVGVMGHSFGGYGVLSLIVQSTQFKAAVDSAGMSNAIDWYGQLDDNGGSLYTGQTETFVTGGTLWEKRDKFVENSPVFYLDRIQTPLLILQGTKDDATQSHLSDQVFVFLRRLEKEVEYAKYTDEVHAPGLWSYANQADYLNRIVSWFDRWLKAPAVKKQ